MCSWNIFYVIFAILSIVSIVFVCLSLVKKKGIYIVAPVVVLIGAIAFYSCYYTVGYDFDSPKTLLAVNFAAEISQSTLDTQFEKTDKGYVKTSEYDGSVITYTVLVKDDASSSILSNYNKIQPQIKAKFSRLDMQGMMRCVRYTDVIAQRGNFLNMRTGKYQQEVLVSTSDYECDIILTSKDKDNSSLLDSMKAEYQKFV